MKRIGETSVLNGRGPGHGLLVEGGGGDSREDATTAGDESDVDDETSRATEVMLVNTDLGTLSLMAYLVGISVSIWCCFAELFYVAATLHIVIVFVAGFIVDKDHYEVWWRGSLLGVLVAFGALLSSTGGPYFGLGWYIVFMSLFHYLEYLVTALTNPLNLNTDSFLLNHSVAYGVAATAGLTEYFIEMWLYPDMKQCLWLSVAGAIGCGLGDTFRKLAMFHAGSNFNHIVQGYKQDEHTLVRNGVFAYFRHPSYVGWFYWSISTQVVLCNPVCAVLYALVSWKFFSERVEVEEYYLLEFFGPDYAKYQREVPTGLPFIEGYKGSNSEGAKTD